MASPRPCLGAPWDELHGRHRNAKFQWPLHGHASARRLASASYAPASTWTILSPNPPLPRLLPLEHRIHRPRFVGHNPLFPLALRVCPTPRCTRYCTRGVGQLPMSTTDLSKTIPTNA